MAEYIELDALQASLQRKKAGAANGRCTDGWNDCLMRCKSVVSCFPAADVAPVVRCENCTSGIMSDDNKYIICCRLGVGMELDDFCSYGERKNGGGGYATD